MTDKAYELYFKNHSKVILPSVNEPSQEDNIQLAATVAANFAELGFVMDKKSIDMLAKAHANEIEDFYFRYDSILKDAVGADRNHKPFYPNFPAEVMERDRLDIFIDQLIYGMSGFTLKPDVYETVKKNFPFMGETVVHDFSAVTADEYINDMKNIMRSATAFSRGQIEELSWFFNEQKEKVADILPSSDSIKQKENKTILTCLFKTQTGKDLKTYLKDPTDVLRFAAVMSSLRDIGATDFNDMVQAFQKAALMYDKDNAPSFNLSKRDWRFVLKVLNETLCADPRKPEDLYNHKSEWKRFFKKVHYNECKAMHLDAVCAASKVIRENIKLDRYSRRIEMAVQNNDLDTALAEAKKHPGDFIRRFDKLLRMGIESNSHEQLMESLSDVASKSGIAPVLSLSTHIQRREVDDYSRSFVSPKTNKIYTTSKKNRNRLPKDIIDAVKDSCYEGLSKKFAEKGHMGRVYISPEMARYKTPKETRTMNSGVDVSTMGTVEKVPSDKDTLRIFTGWNNNKTSRVDLDLSATMVNTDGTMIHIGWDSDYQRTGIVYSGDVQDGGERSVRSWELGAATDCAVEYIDMDTKQLKESGVQYVIVSVALYTGAEDFDHIEDACFGYMSRSEKDRGKLFEAKTVKTSMELNGATRLIIPLIYDVQKEQLIWANKQIDKDTFVASQAMESLARTLPMIIIERDNLLPFNTLIELNARANGELTEDPRKADIAFMTAFEKRDYLEKNGEHALDNVDIHYPNDVSYATGVLLASPIQGQDLFHPDKEPEKELVEEFQR